MENAFFALAVIVLTLAAIYFVRAMTNFFLHRKNKPLYAITLFEVNCEEDIEYSVRNFIWSSSWNNIPCQELVLIIKENASADSVKICEMLSGEYPVVNFCTADKLSDYIKSRFNN
jgi:hypothetical protein